MRDPGRRDPGRGRGRHGHSRARGQARARARASYPQPPPDRRAPGPVCDRPGTGQEGVGRGRLQPLQARLRRPRPGRGRFAASVCRAGRRGADQEQRAPHRLHGQRQDAPGADAGQAAGRALHHRRRHHADRGGLCGRRCGDHPGRPVAGRRLGRGAGGLRHRLHRRDRQDRAQGRRQPQHHARCERRRGAAGAAEDHRRHHGQRAPQHRPQTPPAGVHPARHAQHPLHLRRRFRPPARDCAPAAAAPRQPGLRRPR